mmetsp:Transcript_55616/g.143256  ORF Transcript_55616/g.143256 Transcript_55616/m.143256 type:complete len:716 (+) Transcript_55616:127-2274(+)
MSSLEDTMRNIDRSIERSLSDASEWFAQFADLSWVTGDGGGRMPLGLTKDDKVHVWHDRQGRWIEDGVVLEGTPVDLMVNGSKVPAGSLKVQYDNRSGIQWIHPVEARDILRKVPRPRARAPDRSQADFLQELHRVEKNCREMRSQFTDTSFQIPLSSKVTSVNRVQEITRHDGQILNPAQGRVDWKLFRGVPRADDVLQGELGDCWFLSALAVLADFQEGRFVRALLPGQDDVSPVAAYLVRLCIGGQWRGVLVDDRLPCMGGGRYHIQMAYCVTTRMQLWASIIEKAFAKACGSYEAIRGGEAGEALEMLTGWPSTMIIFGKSDFNADIFWAQLCSSRDCGFLMTCSTKRVSAMSLETDHVYSLIDVAEVQTKSGVTRLLKIRNPHSKSKWQGDWSDGSARWTPALRRKLGVPEEGQPHIFWMALDDFLYQFAHCTICCIRSAEWYEARQSVHIPAGDVPNTAFILEASEMTECSLSLVQPGDRLRKGPFFRGLENQPLACIGFVLLKMDGSQPNAIASAHMRRTSSASVETCWLQAGRYMLVPLSHHYGKPLNVTLACFSSKKVTMREQQLDRVQLRHAWAAYARENDMKCERFHGAVLHIGKGEGGSVVAFAENFGSGYFNVELSFRSESLQFSRKAATTNDWLAPGTGQLLQIAQPGATQDGQVSWRSSHKFSMTARPPDMRWHSPAADHDLHMPFAMGASSSATPCITQ